MLISVVIPVFNRPAAAARAVRSVRGQHGIDPADLEIIAVDDASIPPLVLDDAGAGLKIIRLECNGGPSVARNAGIKAARGDYIAFLDSDDVWLEDMLARQIEAMRELERTNPTGALLAVVCSVYYPDRASGAVQLRIPKGGTSVLDFASGCWFSPGSALLIRRSAFDRIGLFDERLRRLEDLDWFIRFGRAGGQLHATEHAGAVIAPSGTASSAAVSTAAATILEKFSSGGREALPAPALRRLKAYLNLEKGVAFLQQSQKLAALRHLSASFAQKPRISAALEDFWIRRGDIPPQALEIYRAMVSAKPTRS